MFRQLDADHHVPFKCLGTNLEFFAISLRPNLLYADIWAKLWQTAAPAARLAHVLCYSLCRQGPSGRSRIYSFE